MCSDASWEQVGSASPDFARDKSNEMKDSITFSEDNPLPIWKMPIGGIAIWTDDNIPSGWIACRGQTLLIADYPELYAVIGTRFGMSGGTGFLLPDMRQRFPVGSEHLVSGYEIGDIGGARSVTLDTTQIPAHTHAQLGYATGATTPVQNIGGARTGSATTLNNTGSTGGGASHENRPPYMAMEFIIYTGVA